MLENNINKYKEIPEGPRQLIGLAGLTLAIIITFFILNNIIGVTDKSVEKKKSVEDYEKVFASFPKGRLNFFKGSEGHQLSASEYEAVCNNTKIVTQRAIMGANIIDIKAQELYNNNGNKIDKYFVKWDDSTKKCIAKYTIRALQGTTETVTVSGEAKGFLKTDFDTRVYFIKNF